MHNAQLSVRNLNPAVISKLKSRAKKHGRSLESEIRMILAAVIAQDENPNHDDALAQLRALQKEFEGKQFTDSTTLLRQDRER